jgi:hypothetical protein
MGYNTFIDFFGDGNAPVVVAREGVLVLGDLVKLE